MKSYLDLVSTYAKAHKKKNRLTIICIAVSVMLVTAIFGMADMALQSQTDSIIRKYGNWHATVSGISEQTAVNIAAREDVAVFGFLGMASTTTFHGKELVVQSSSEELAQQMNLTVTEGKYPTTETEALLDKSALKQFGLSIGDTIEVAFCGGQTRQYQISGTYEDFSSLQGTDSHGLQLAEGNLRFLPDGEYKEYGYIQFKNRTNINQALEDIKLENSLADNQVSTNLMLLGVMGQSDDTAMLEVYLTAAILFVLVSMAGIFMIASSFNMSILERTQFFGLLRCLGATKRQIKKYIRREGLLYCLKAIPIGLLAGTGILWLAVFVLNALNLQYLPEMPQFQISILGVLSGIVIGVLVVMIASSSPAKKAAKVSPQSAVTGNVNQSNNQSISKASNTNLFHVDTAMGLRHAFSNKKSMVLIGGSFAISIVMFLCFTILITFMNHALSPLKPYAPDLTIECTTGTELLPFSLKEELSNLHGAEKVYGRMLRSNIPASDEKSSNTATLVSYDEPQFEWAKDAMISGDMNEVQNGNGVLVDYGYSQEFDWQIGDIITLNVGESVQTIEVAGIISDASVDSSNGEWVIVCSEKTFTALTGTSGYRVIDIQASEDISNEVRSFLSDEMKLLDLQKHNEEVRAGYMALAVFVYGFLIVIAIVALINIINTVNASVSSRMNHYGVMRAVGMSCKQLKKVVRAEAAAYAITGSLLGGVLGMLLHRFFFGMLITSNWGQLWEPPIMVLIVVISASILTTFLAVIAPARKIAQTSIVNVVNAG